MRACEEELYTLKELGTAPAHWWGGRDASSVRTAYLSDKMLVAENKIEALERRNGELRKVLAQVE